MVNANRREEEGIPKQRLRVYKSGLFGTTKTRIHVGMNGFASYVVCDVEKESSSG